MSQATSALARLAQTALAIAVVVFGWSIVAAIRISPTEPLSSAVAGANRPATGGALAPLADSEVDQAIAHDLFSPTRQAPAQRYTLDVARAPSDSDDGDVITMAADEPTAPLLPTVHGTAVGGDGLGFAMCSTGGEPARVVRVGDAVGEFTVVTIERTRVTFRDPSGHRVTVDALPSPAGDEQ